MKNVNKGIYRVTRLVLATGLFVALSGCQHLVQRLRADTVRLVSPADGAKVFMPHPHFQWERPPNDRLEDAYQIQIRSDGGKRNVDETLAVVSRHVCAKALPAGAYHWRVRKAGGKWSDKRRFEVGEPKIFRVANSANSEAIRAVILEAAKNTRAKVLFEPGEY